MTTYFSFLSTLQGFYVGAIVPNSGDRYVFAGNRQRILPIKGIPGYVARMNDLQPELSRIANDHLLTYDQLHPLTLERWNNFREVLLAADREDRICYCYGDNGELLHVINDLFRRSKDGYWYGKYKKVPGFLRMGTRTVLLKAPAS